jgi:hypothetical protein
MQIDISALELVPPRTGNPMKTRKQTVTVYVEACTSCGKEIQGSSPAVLKRNIENHKAMAHRKREAKV